MQANLFALAAIALWASLAALGVALAHVPPFLLTGVALLIGSLPAWLLALHDRRLWQVTRPVFALGVATLFGFHFLLFVALRMAPAVEVNLVNYIWPLLIVVMSPLYLPGGRLRGVHTAAALAGFAGAALAILGGQGTSPSATAEAGKAAAGLAPLGYALALGSGFIWANYSLQTKRLALLGRSFPAAAIGLFGLVSGALSLVCHVALEPAATLAPRDWFLMAATGLGPLGAAFYLWDAALKRGDARQIGLLSYLTPLASTMLLLAVIGRPLSWHIALAAMLIIGAAIVGSRR